MRVWRVVGSALAVLVLALGLAGPAAAVPARVALVLGNGGYERVPKLANPAGDARAMAAALKVAGFTVIEGYDLGVEAMLARIHGFGQAAEGSEVALVFYAGHGLQVDGRNYLLPVDAKLVRETDLRREAVEVDEILGELRQVRRLRVVILDACRDNPFLARMSRSVASRSASPGRGFARVEEIESDTLIAFATKADAVAEDGKGTHSPYTTALLQHLATPDLTVERFFGKVRDSVLETTQGRQQPYVYGSLGGEPVSLTGALAPVSDVAELAFWDTIKASTEAADFRAYLEAYPSGRFAALARARGGAGEGAASGAAPAGAVAPLACERLIQETDQTVCRTGGAADLTALAARLAAGPERDEAAAAALYQRAASLGDPQAQNGLGVLLEDGRGVAADAVAAARSYRQAALRGLAEAQYNLGVLLEAGRGVTRNEAEAALWYQKAADQGSAEARVSLALLLESGRGVGRDLAGAARFYRLAAGQGHPLGQAYLAAMLEQGRGVGKDLAEAIRLYRLAAAQGNALALAALQRLSP
ncbi:MAG: caspase family protein [Rhodospirillaceae bacterium]